MSSTWGTTLTELVPLALVIALSPLSVIPGILVLHTPRPRPTGLAFLAGWVSGLAVVTAIFVVLASLVGSLDDPPRWASFVRIAIGAALVVFGVYRWAVRHRSAHTPAWMRTLTDTTPTKAGATGAALVVANPKVLFLCIAAGLAIGTAGLGVAGAWSGLAVYVAVSASTVALPILAYAVSGDRLDEPLGRLKVWMEEHNAALMAIVLVVIGILVLYKGIHGL